MSGTYVKVGCDVAAYVIMSKLWIAACKGRQCELPVKKVVPRKDFRPCL
ncbi:MAG: hypothetical protein HFH02_07820 [Dorea sp.]|nr:hypothetical protein [Dorea sp.]